MSELREIAFRHLTEAQKVQIELCELVYPEVHYDTKGDFEKWLYQKGYDMALSAMQLGAKYHTGVRKDKITPEFNHSLTVAHFVRSLRLPKAIEETALTIAILHDIVEDYPQVLKELRTFPKEVRKEVLLLSKVRGTSKIDPERYHRVLADTIIGSIVKGFDRLHNVKTMEPFSAEKKVEYAKETFRFIYPMLDKAAQKFKALKNYFLKTKQQIQDELEKVFNKEGLPLPVPA